MGIKWTVRLRVDFEMEEGVSEHLAERRLKIAAGQFEQFIEAGIGASSPARPGEASGWNLIHGARFAGLGHAPP